MYGVVMVKIGFYSMSCGKGKFLVRLNVGYMDQDMTIFPI